MEENGERPCDGDGVCMICKKKPPLEETITCKTCGSPWHTTCLASPLQNLSDTLEWLCPDCTNLNPSAAPAAGPSEKSGSLVAEIRAIEADALLTESEKARRRQMLLSGKAASSSSSLEEEGEDGGGVNHEKKRKDGVKDLSDILNEDLKCSICMQLLDMPVSTPCGHNFCLKCFQKWVGLGKRTCAICREKIPSDVATQPRINSMLVVFIRMAKTSRPCPAAALPKVHHFVRNEDRPDKAFTTERAKKAGKANACSGQIFVTVPPDHFGPIPAENDPKDNRGVRVGDSWEDRLACRQWGAHLPHVAGIAGQSNYGAQSVALSGGYIDDEDHGEWFLYTGSGGRDLSGNKRTNKEQSFDQKFEKSNEALRVSCKKGYPVRVVRSHKEKRSVYAPDKHVRYDGIYRIEKCWRKNGIQGYKVCRYLFVRCDNEPSPWNCNDIHGDCPRPLPFIEELEHAIDITERKGPPSWDYDEEQGCWTWKKPPPVSRKLIDGGNPDGKRTRTRKVKRQGQNMSMREKLLNEFSCQICRKVMTNPLTTPCAHNFCKACLEGAFAGQSFIRERTCQGRRTLRIQKNVMKCPSCTNDIAAFLQNPQVNRELMGVIESLQQRIVEAEAVEDSNEDSDGTHETPDLVADTETSDVSIQILEEAKDSILKHQTEAKPQQTGNEKIATDDNDMSNICGQEEKTLPEQPDTVNNGTGVDIDESEMADTEELPTAKLERIADNDGSQLMEDVKGRNKRAKTVVAH